jgi:AraC-like DNA-binding protein
MPAGRASSTNTHARESRPALSQRRDLDAKPDRRKRVHVQERPGRLVVGRTDVASGPHSSDRETLHGVSALIDAVRYALAGEHEQAQHSARIAIEALDAEIRCNAPPARTMAVSAATKPGRGGLAPWQVRRVATYMDGNLAASIQCEDLARVTRLSVSHFMRAFRDSFGAPPHAYLMRRRMERAQGLMLTTDTPLGQIALDCGLADQSHMTRLFRRLVGESPAAWRRARIDVGIPAGGDSSGPSKFRPDPLGCQACRPCERVPQMSAPPFFA